MKCHHCSHGLNKEESLTTVLTEEHTVIKRVLTALETATAQLEKGKGVPLEIFSQGIDFIRNFADKCHHHKEEDFLFTKAVELGLPKEGGPIGVMLHEHDLGRELVKKATEALKKYSTGDIKAIKELTGNLQQFIELLREHIDKEDNILYPMIESMLPEQEQKELTNSFEKVEEEEMGEGTHEKYLKLAEEIEREVEKIK